jgi:NifB/MoaA-like Fe-S oxidoreductase
VLDIIHKWQERLYSKYGLHFVHASDEWYILAGEELPEENRYDGYLQLENGVGMLRLLITEFDEAFNELKTANIDKPQRTVSVATGLLAYKYLEKMAQRLMGLYPELKINIYPIRNEFFGEQITVSGLLTGQDILAQLKGKALGEKLLLPQNVLKSGEEIFLDDMSIKELENTLQVPIDIVKSSGRDFIDAVVFR